LQLGPGLSPLGLHLAVTQYAASGKEVEPAIVYAHAAQRDVEVGCRVDRQRSAEPAVILSVYALMIYDEPARLVLGHAADRRRGVERVDKLTRQRSVAEAERIVGAQMEQVCRRGGIWSAGRYLFAIPGKDMGNVCAHIALLLHILGRPAHALAVTVGLDGPHRAGEGHRAPLVATTLEQHFGRGHEPRARSVHRHEGDELMGIDAAGLEKKVLGADGRGRLHPHATREHELVKTSCRQLTVKTGEVAGVSLPVVGTHLVSHHAIDHLGSGLHLAGLHHVGAQQQHGMGGRGHEGGDDKALAAAKVAHRTHHLGHARGLRHVGVPALLGQPVAHIIRL